MSSQDPLLASFSYKSPDCNGSMRGPYCVECMNRSYTSYISHFYSNKPDEGGIPIFLHTTEGDKAYKIYDLVYLNGSRSPFLFRRLPDNVELPVQSCDYRCREAVAKCVPVMITPVWRATTTFIHHVAAEKKSVSGPYFPFLDGCKKEQCTDIISCDDVKFVLLSMHPLIKEFTSNVCKLISAEHFPRDCRHCSKTLESAGACLEHVFSKRHLNKAHSSGVVFSRSKDLAAANELIHEAMQLGANDSTENSTVPGTVEDLSSPLVTKMVISELVSTEETGKPAVVICEGIRDATTKKCELQESEPVQEVSPHDGIDHTLLLGVSESDLPLLYARKQSDRKWTPYNSLARKEVRQICSNFLCFAPLLEPLCGATRHPVCTKFIASCPSVCQLCDIEGECLCQMVTHFFSQPHWKKLLQSCGPFFRADFTVWTDVVDALMTETTPDRQNMWRRMNCWTNIRSPETPLYTVNPGTETHGSENNTSTLTMP